MKQNCITIELYYEQNKDRLCLPSVFLREISLVLHELEMTFFWQFYRMSSSFCPFVSAKCTLVKSLIKHMKKILISMV